MDLTVEEYVDGVLSKEAYDEPSDRVACEDLEMKYPPWYDEEKFNRGRSVYWKFSFGYSASILPGIVATAAVPTILEVLVSSQRSSSNYTAYRRYMSTSLHVISWFRYELKPGSKSWRSLQAVRSRHVRSGRAARVKKQGNISQRDMALTQFGLFGFAILRPDRFGIRQLEAGDWDAFVYSWKVIGYMLGMQDRYNLCRGNYVETRRVCELILDRVYTPCLENVPEYFEHMTRVVVNGLGTVNPSLEVGSMHYTSKYLGGVPGYIMTEAERIAFQSRLREHLKGKDQNSGVEATSLIQKYEFGGLPDRPPRMLYLKDYESLETIPAYKQLSLRAKYKMAIAALLISFYSTLIGRKIMNWYFMLALFMLEYFPYGAFFAFGIKNSYVDMFKDSIADKTKPKPNSEYYKPDPHEYKYFKSLKLPFISQSSNYFS